MHIPDIPASACLALPLSTFLFFSRPSLVFSEAEPGVLPKPSGEGESSLEGLMSLLPGGTATQVVL